MSDMNQLIIEQSIAHWPVFAGVGFMLFAAWKWLIPNSVKSSLENGGGDAVRRVVKSELHQQDERIADKISRQNEVIDNKLKEQDGRIENKIKELDTSNKERMLEILTKHEELERVTMQNVVLKLKNDNDIERTKVNKTLDMLDTRALVLEKKLKIAKFSVRSTRKNKVKD